MPPKKKEEPPCANPVLVGWLEEWLAEAQQKGTKMEFSIRKALRNLRKFPVPLKSGQEALVVEGIGKFMAKRIDDNIRKYGLNGEKKSSSQPSQSQEDSFPDPIPAPSPDPIKRPAGGASRDFVSISLDEDDAVTAAEVQAPKPKKPRKTSQREYVPAFRSGGYALLKALYLDNQGQGEMTKIDLMKAAQDHADASFTVPATGKYQTAWSSMGTLIKRDLVIRRSHPPKFSLSQTGIELAEKILRAEGQGDMIPPTNNQSDDEAAEEFNDPDDSSGISNANTGKSQPKNPPQKRTIPLSLGKGSAKGDPTGDKKESKGPGRKAGEKAKRPANPGKHVVFTSPVVDLTVHPASGSRRRFLDQGVPTRLVNVSSQPRPKPTTPPTNHNRAPPMKPPSKDQWPTGTEFIHEHSSNGKRPNLSKAANPKERYGNIMETGANNRRDEDGHVAKKQRVDEPIRRHNADTSPINVCGFEGGRGGQEEGEKMETDLLGENDWGAEWEGWNDDVINQAPDPVRLRFVYVDDAQHHVTAKDGCMVTVIENTAVFLVKYLRHTKPPSLHIYTDAHTETLSEICDEEYAYGYLADVDAPDMAPGLEGVAPAPPKPANYQPPTHCPAYQPPPPANQKQPQSPPSAQSPPRSSPPSNQSNHNSWHEPPEDIVDLTDSPVRPRKPAPQLWKSDSPDKASNNDQDDEFLWLDDDFVIPDTPPTAPASPAQPQDSNNSAQTAMSQSQEDSQSLGQSVGEALRDHLKRLEDRSAQKANQNAPKAGFVQKPPPLLRAATAPASFNRERKEPAPKTTQRSNSLADGNWEGAEGVGRVRLQPGEYEVVLVLDNREIRGQRDRGYIQQELQGRGVNCVVRPLSLGDFIWVARTKPTLGGVTGGEEMVLGYIGERKRMDDLSSSIMDGRFREQQFRLKSCGLYHVLYVVEDHGPNDAHSVPPDRLQTAMVSVQTQWGFHLRHTANCDDTVEFLALMTKMLTHRFRGKTLVSVPLAQMGQWGPDEIAKLGNKLPVASYAEYAKACAKRQTLTLTDLFARQLMCIRTMTPERAKAIITEYPTPRALVEAYEGCMTDQERRDMLAGIKHSGNKTVGKKLSETVFRLYCDWDYPQQPDD